MVSLNAAPLFNKKAGLHCCCSAIRGSGIAFDSEQATPKPTPICTITHTPTYSVHGYGYTYPEDIKMLQCVGINEIYQISNSQAQSAYDAFIMSCNSASGDLILFNIVQSSSILQYCTLLGNYACKGTN